MTRSLRSMIPASAKPSLRLARIASVVLRPRKHLFLFSHMRSYSSLLGHILGSNPEIDGYVELQQSYETELDFIRSSLKVYETSGNQLHGKYVFDKILHGHLEVGSIVLKRPQAVAIFAVRDPGDTVRSTVAMAQRGKKPDWKGDIDKVAAYYQRRTTQLVEVANEFTGRSCVLEAEHLVDNPTETLRGLTQFLELKNPLRADYDVFSHTGKPQFGDPGNYIKSGRLVKERDTHDEVELPAGMAAELSAHRATVLDQLRDACDATF